MRLGLLFTSVLLLFSSACGKSEPPAMAPSPDPSPSSAVVATPTPPKFTGSFVFKYENTGFEDYFQALADSGVKRSMENTASLFMLPVDVDVCFRECTSIFPEDPVNAYSQQSDHRIVMCYELLRVLWSMVTRANPEESKEWLVEEWANIVEGIFLHELSHVLMDYHNLPIPFSEEDQADSLALYILSTRALNDSSSKNGLHAGASFASYHLYMRNFSGDGRVWGEHSLNSQRFFNGMCLIYGSDPERFTDIVKNGHLPQERAERCPSEWRKVSASWRLLLSPYVKSIPASQIEGTWELEWPWGDETGTPNDGTLVVQTSSASLVVRFNRWIDQTVISTAVESGQFHIKTSRPVVRGTDIVHPRYIADELLISRSDGLFKVSGLNLEKRWEPVRIISNPSFAAYDRTDARSLDGKWKLIMFGDEAELELKDGRGKLSVKIRETAVQEMVFQSTVEGLILAGSTPHYSNSSAPVPRYAADQLLFKQASDGQMSVFLRDEVYVAAWKPVRVKTFVPKS